MEGPLESCADMQRLCKHFYLASTDEGASLQRPNWKSPYIKENAFWRKEGSVEEKDETFTWGHIVGSHFGEANATTATARGNVKTKAVTDLKGNVHKRYVIKNSVGLCFQKYYFS